MTEVIDVFLGLHDNYTQQNTPTETQTFSLYGLVNFQVQYWTGSAWATIPGGNVSGNNKVWRKFAFAPITTNKIRLWITGVPDSWSRLVELQAWQSEPGVTNLALNKPATQSSTAWSAPASRGVDGNTDGNFSNGSVTHTATESQPWWQVDLQSVANIQNINVWNRTDCCGEALSNFYVFVSDNPFTANDVTSTQNQPGVSTYFVAGQGGVPSTIGINRTGRYVRVQLGGTERLSVAEVQVFGGGSGAQVRWLVTDHLGTPRMVLDQSGSLATVKRHDYLPFGEELIAPIGGRTAAQGYSGGDGMRQQFSQKERDIETGLDYFGARYYSSVQGRFSSADPGNIGVDEDDPQSWNGYGYARHSPLVYSDPDGREYLVCDANGDYCRTVSDEDFWAERRKLVETGNVYTGSRDFFESGEIRNADGGIVATYIQTSIDDPAREAVFAIRNAVDPIPQATLDFFKLSLELGLPNGVIRYVLRAPSTITTLGSLANAGSAASQTAREALLNAAKDTKLRNLISDLYRKGAKIGSGSTADAIRYERSTGILLSKVGHSPKGKQYVRALERLVNDGNLSPSDRAIAQHIINDLKDALK